MTLAYTINKTLTQKCTLLRDMSAKDELAGREKEERQVIETPRCRFWWWREAAGRAVAREYATPQRTINFTGGGILVEPGSVVADGDHVGDIEDRKGNVIIAGPFRVVAVEQVEDHLEAALMRP